MFFLQKGDKIMSKKTNVTGPFFYFFADRTAPAPAHAQDAVKEVITTDNGDGTTTIEVVAQVVTVGEVTGWLTKIIVDADGQEVSINKEGFDPGDATVGKFVFTVRNDLINEYGLLGVSVTITFEEHPSVLGGIFLAVN